MSIDIRWKQRYSNFQKALVQLANAVEKGEYSDLERQGLIQCFEFTIELAWKTLQDLLDARGYNISGPKPVIKQSFHDGLIIDGTAWVEMLESRNITTHTYNEKVAVEISEKIMGKYYPLLDELDKQLAKEKDD